MRSAPDVTVVEHHPHFQRPGPLTWVVPQRDVVPGQQTEDVKPEHQATVARINNMLRSRMKFRLRIELLWHKVVGRGETLPFEELPEFVQRVARKLDLPIEAFGDLEFVFMYDFAGDEELNFKEAYTLVRDKIVDYRRVLGGHPVISVPQKSLQEAGYRRIRVLATGGQGTASLVKDGRNRSKVVKVYSKGRANAVSLDNLKEEMENMRRSEHPNIAVCHEIFQDNDHLYMVSDAYMGGDLSTIQKTAASQQVEITEAWYKGIFLQAFTGLDYLHRSCVVHCDIKESNIMVKRPDYLQPEIVIIDLGMASTLKPSRGACGTPGYMPPETWDSGAWFPRGDVFSMGVVCVQMLTDNIPDAATGKPGIFQKACTNFSEVATLTRKIDPPFASMAPSSEELLEWLPACLEKDFQQRPKPAEVLANSWFDIGEPWFFNRRLGCCRLQDLPWFLRCGVRP